MGVELHEARRRSSPTAPARAIRGRAAGAPSCATTTRPRNCHGGEADTTNNRMELMAAIEALNALKRAVRGRSLHRQQLCQGRHRRLDRRLEAQRLEDRRQEAGEERRAVAGARRGAQAPQGDLALGEGPCRPRRERARRRTGAARHGAVQAAVASLPKPDCCPGQGSAVRKSKSGHAAVTALSPRSGRRRWRHVRCGGLRHISDLLRAAPGSSPRRLVDAGLGLDIERVTLPSSTIIEKRFVRTPMPAPDMSPSRPGALAKSPLPSARIQDLAFAAGEAGPGAHHVMVVDGHHGDRVDALGEDGVVVLEIAGQMVVAAGRREGARHAEQHDLACPRKTRSSSCPWRRPASSS